jgi:hypothetical protein
LEKLRGVHSTNKLDKIRLTLGSIITFSLELLVAADVIDTLTKPAHAYKVNSFAHSNSFLSSHPPLRTPPQLSNRRVPLCTH